MSPTLFTIRVQSHIGIKEMGSSLKYLDIIAEHLSQHHAAVLVGAGFSKNAISINDDITSSPSWNELKEVFINKLCSDKKRESESKIYRDLSPTLLAEYIEVLYGRPVLDQLLQDSIRDLDYLPSSLHKTLLQLPWTDIFTTNYDTLLERAAEQVTNEKRRILVVKTLEDLIGSSGQTRIIKLHGSFPSNYPFIVTAEDYRTYPQKFAPFVNTVQQSIIENTLCLMGFSGNDPNFEKWIGWIRDSLGSERCQNIYMFVLHDLSEAEKELLRRRKIVPVVIKTLFACNDGASPEKLYKSALEYLNEKVNSYHRKRSWDINLTFREEDKLQDVLRELQKIHASYPGWMMLKLEKRQKIINGILDKAFKLMIGADSKGTSNSVLFDFLYEYDWYREVALLPLSVEAEAFYKQVLKKQLRVDINKLASIQISLLRDARESTNWKRWEEIRKVLSGYDNLSDGIKNRLIWEDCLFHLNKLEVVPLDEVVKKWEPPIGSEWGLRKASLLLELGKIKEAHQLVNFNIHAIRKRLQRNEDNLHLLSLESALMQLDNWIKKNYSYNEHLNKNNEDLDSFTWSDIVENRSLYSPELRKNDESKRENLSNNDNNVEVEHSLIHMKYEVDWHQINEEFTSFLKRGKNHIESKYGFDFGYVSTSINFSSTSELSKALTFLRFREESGVPFQIGKLRIDADQVRMVASNLSKDLPYLSFILLIRSGSYAEVQSVFGRNILISLSTGIINNLTKVCTSVLSVITNEKDVDTNLNIWGIVSQARIVLPTFLSVFCTRCSVDLFKEIFDAIKRIYQSPIRYEYFTCCDLIRRFVPLAIYYLQPDFIKDCYQLRYVKYKNFRDKYLFPDLFNFVMTLDKTTVSSLFGEQLKSLDVSTISLSNSNINEVESLLIYNEYDLLSTNQKKLLGDFIWKKDNPLPDGWSVLILLDIPSPKSINKIEYIKNNFIQTIRDYSVSKGFSSKNRRLFVDFILFVNENKIHFSVDQVKDIVTNLISKVERLLQESNNDSEDYWRKCARNEVYLVLEFLWLLIKKENYKIDLCTDIELQEKIFGHFKESRIVHYGFMSMFWNRLERQNSSDLFLKALSSADEAIVEWSYRALQLAVTHSNLRLLTKKEISIGLDILSQHINFCADKQLDNALRTAIAMVKHCPRQLTLKTILTISNGLYKLYDLTKIENNDTVKTTNRKGEIRILSASLAKSMYDNPKISTLCEKTLKLWMDAINNESEFIEIRNVGKI